MPTSKNHNRFRRPIGLIVFLGMALSSVVDVSSDISEGSSWKHIVVELAVVLFSFASFIWLWREKQTLHVTAKELQSELVRSDLAANEWQSKAAAFAAGLISAIDSQFLAWGLSQAEKDVSLMLIKEFSLKEIAELRKTSERTVRQQAQEAYRKAGLDGRVQLAAYFLEDLLQGPGAVGMTSPRNSPVL